MASRVTVQALPDGAPAPALGPLEQCQCNCEAAEASCFAGGCGVPVSSITLVCEDGVIQLNCNAPDCSSCNSNCNVGYQQCAASCPPDPKTPTLDAASECVWPPPSLATGTFVCAQAMCDAATPPSCDVLTSSERLEVPCYESDGGLGGCR